MEEGKEGTCHEFAGKLAKGMNEGDARSVLLLLQEIGGNVGRFRKAHTARASYSHFQARA